MYLRTFVTSRADIAAQAGASTTYSAGSVATGGYRLLLGAQGDGLTGAHALNVTYLLYWANTQSRRGETLLCTAMVPITVAPNPGMRTVMKNNPDKCNFYRQIVGTPPAGNRLCEKVGVGDIYGIAVGLNEKVPMTFMKILGVQDQWINDVRATSLVRSSNSC